MIIITQFDVQYLANFDSIDDKTIAYIILPLWINIILP